jgi:cytochrome P450
MLPLIATVLGLLVIYQLYKILRPSTVPGPYRLFNIGNLIDSIRDKTKHGILCTWADRHGPLYGINVLGREIHVVSGPQHIEHILKNTAARTNMTSNGLAVLFKQATPTLEGEPWALRRKALIAGSNQLSVKESTFERLDEMYHVLDSFLQPGKPVDIQHAIHYSSYLMAAKILYSNKSDTFTPEAIFFRLQKLIEAFQKRLFVPRFLWRWLFSDEEELESHRQFFRDAIGASLEHSEHGNDYASFMMDQGMDMDEVYNEVMALFVALSDSVTSVTASALRYILVHDDVRAKLLDEIQHSNAYDVAKLDYLDAVVHETLRLCPVVAVLERHNHDALEFPDGKVMLPESDMYLNFVHYQSKTRPDFSPDRYLVDKPEYFYPFGGYARRCPGMKMGLTLTKNILFHLLKTYTFELVQGQSFERIMHINLKFEHGLHVIPKTIKH